MFEIYGLSGWRQSSREEDAQIWKEVKKLSKHDYNEFMYCAKDRRMYFNTGFGDPIILKVRVNPLFDPLYGA